MLSRFNPFLLWWKDLHKPTIYSIFSLVIIGLFAVFSASYQAGETIHAGNLYYFKKHVIFVAIGIVLFFIISIQSTESILKLGMIGFVCCIFLLFATISLSGKSVKGAERWIDLRFITLQPSELLKPFFIIISAHIYYFFEKSQNYAFPFLHGIIVMIIIITLYFQPDFGMILTYFSLTFFLVFFSSIRFKWVMFLIIGLVATTLIAFFTLPHVKYRIINFVKGEKMYQTDIAKEAISRGGLLGSGIGMGEYSQKLPDSHNDFIFSRIGEEFGGLALVGIMLIFLVLTLSNLAFVKQELTLYQQLTPRQWLQFEKHQEKVIINNYIILLTICLIFFEASFNAMVNLSLLPPKGMVFPFISYGGSSLIAHGILAGILCVANRKRYRFFVGS